MRLDVRKKKKLNSDFIGLIFTTALELPTQEKWFCYGNKIRDDKYFFFVAATKNFAAATKRFVDGTKNSVVVTKCFCYPYFNK